MARFESDDIRSGDISSGGNTSQQKTVRVELNGQDVVPLPDSSFVRDSEILRDGPDLIIKGPDGTEIVVESYFNALNPPFLSAPDGVSLTPELVNSFVQSAGPLQYAQLGTLNDVSPVGSIQELSGEATVTRTDGSTEPLLLGTAIYQGDIIETSGNGAVNIEFTDESSFAVSENAKLSIDEYIFDPATESGTTNVSVLRGLFMFTSGLIGRDDPDDVEIDTPMGSIGIRGTTIAGDATTGEVTVLEGAIVLRAFNGSEMTLSNQLETARFDPSGGGIAYEGVQDAGDFSNKFNSIKSVTPATFTSIDNTSNDNSDGDAKSESSDNAENAEAEPEAAPDAENNTESEAAAEEATVEEATTEDTTSEESAAEESATEESASEEAPAEEAAPEKAAAESAPEKAAAEPAAEQAAPEQPAAEQAAPATDNGPAPDAGFDGKNSFDGKSGADGQNTKNNSGTTREAAPNNTQNNTNEPAGNNTTQADSAPADTTIVTPTIIGAPRVQSAGTFDTAPAPGTIVASIEVTLQGGPSLEASFRLINTFGGRFSIVKTGRDTADIVMGDNTNFFNTEVPNLNIAVRFGLDNATTTHRPDINPPELLNDGAELDEGASIVLSASDLSIEDPGVESTELKFELTQNVTNGVLRLNGSTLSVGDTFSMADINNGLVTYTHDDSETTTDSLKFTATNGNSTIAGNTFAIDISEINDNPIFTASGPFSIDENSAAATVVGDIDANDGDGSATDTGLTYSIQSGNTDSAFSINTTTGVLSVNNVSALDFETNSQFTLTIRVSDGVKTSDETVIININDVFESLDLDAGLSTDDGFVIQDDIGEGFGLSIAVADTNLDGLDDLFITKEKSDLLFTLPGSESGYETLDVGSDFAGTPGSSESLESALNAEPTGTDINRMQIDTIGDFNGDGIVDVIISSPTGDDKNSTDDSGQAVIRNIDGTGPSITFADIPNGGSARDEFGQSISGLGDINGDGFDDVIIGAPGVNNGNTDEGSAYVMLGNAYGTNTQLELDELNGFIGGGTSGAGIQITTTEGDSIYTYNGSTIERFDIDGDINANLSSVSSTSGGGGLASLTDFAVDSNTIYYVTSDGKFGVRAEGTTSDTSLTAITNLDGIPSGITVFNDKAYVLTGSEVSIVTSISTAPVFSDELPSANFSAADILSNASVITNDGTNVFILSGDTLVKIDASNNISEIAIDANAIDIAINPETNHAYIVHSSGGGADNVTIINTTGSMSAAGTFNTSGDVPNSGDQIRAIEIKDDSLFVLRTDGVLPGTGTVTTYHVAPTTPATLDFVNSFSNTSSAAMVEATDLIVAGSAGDAFPVLLSNSNLTRIDALPNGLAFDGTGINNRLGNTVSSAGDLNNDGFDDFMISEHTGSSTGEVNIIYGARNPADITNSANKTTITNINLDPASPDVPLLDLGDINGDGINDIAIAETGADRVSVILGGTTTPGTSGTLASFADITIQSGDSNFELASGGSIGDFNGDGINDSVIVMQGVSGGVPQSNLEFYVMYGSNNFDGSTITSVDRNFLNDSSNAFKLTYTIDDGADFANFDIDITSAGDLNGDGFYDIAIGLSDQDNDIATNSDAIGDIDDDADGSVFVVYGRDTGEGAANVITDNDGTDSNAIANNVSASADGQSLVGNENNNILSDESNDDIAFSGGSGNDIFRISNGNFSSIDGGGNENNNFDRVDFILDNGTLDLGSFNDEDIQRIEKINLAGNNQTLILTEKNLFNLMGSSDSGILRINDSNGNGTLRLNLSGANDADVTIAELQERLNADSHETGADESGSGGADNTGFETFRIGGYELQIDDALFTNNNVEII